MGKGVGEGVGFSVDEIVGLLVIWVVGGLTRGGFGVGFVGFVVGVRVGFLVSTGKGKG